MKLKYNESVIQNEPWFSRWFNSAYYHKMYAHRDETEADNFINVLMEELQPTKNANMIDVGCGKGRHCMFLAAKGFDVTGIDLAFDSIKEAKKYQTTSLRFLRHDMRRSFGISHFDYCFSFFTSFGYFKTQRENDIVISNMSRALKPGGKLIFDYLNVDYAHDQLVHEEKKEIDGIHYHISRWSDNEAFYKKITLQDHLMTSPFENIERVAKFDLADFERMFSQNNLLLEEVYGDYQLNPYNKKRSPRLVMIAKKL